MAGGYMGKLLFVDLGNGKIAEESPDDAFCRKFIGGYGFGSKIMYDRMKPGVDPLGPDNVFGVLTGPLTGTPAVIGSRYTVVAKSPLTGGWGDANSGGFFGPAMKFAGYDGAFCSGISEKPVYLFLNEGKAELKDATHLWGKDSNETEDVLRAELGDDVMMVCIGPAGETKSLIACVMNDKGRAAGRSGIGAVMGAKRIKAIVAKGKMDVPLADKAKVSEIRRKYELGGFFDVLKQYGTAGITADSAMSGDSPVKNWAGAGPVDFPNASQISDDAVIAYEYKKFGCWRCPIRCGGHVKVESGPYAVADGHKPEYETLCMFGTLTLNDNVESIIKLNDICNRAGLDTISAGSAVAFAIECYENGLLGKGDTDGLELTWGNHAAIVALTEKIARREGLGDLLADGVKVAAEKIGKGAEQYAMHIGGQEVPAHDPKLIPGLGLTYQLDATPGRHTQGGEMIAPPGGLEVAQRDRQDYTGRGEDQKTLVDMVHVVNATGLCLFGYMCMDARSVPDFLNAVTGWDVSMEECLETGERIANVRHLFNLREGIDPLQIQIPGRIVGDPPLKEGNVRDTTLDMKTMTADFMKAMGWDPDTARPSEARLKALGL